MIKHLQDYATGKTVRLTSHIIFFVDNLKLYSSTTDRIKKQLNLVTRFSQNINMKDMEIQAFSFQ